MVYDVLVVGAGPAGVSAALYARARGCSVLVVEQAAVGGLIDGVSRVSHYAGLIDGETGHQFAARLKAQLDAANIEVKHETAQAVEADAQPLRVQTDAATHEARAVVLATGSARKMLTVDGAAAWGCDRLLCDHLEACRGRSVVVVGGSDGAAKEALYAATVAKRVHMVQIADALMTIAEFKQPIEAADHITVHTGCTVSGLSGTDGALTAVTLRHQDGRETVLTAEADGVAGFEVFVYMGQTPANTLFLPEERAEDGFVKADGITTLRPGVFVCGDIRVKPVRQIATAVADGTLAGIQAAAYAASHR